MAFLRNDVVKGLFLLYSIPCKKAIAEAEEPGMSGLCRTLFSVDAP